MHQRAWLTMRGDMRETTGWGAGATRRGRLFRVIAVVTALVVVPTVAVVGTPQPTLAYAADYPTWQQVQSAVADVKNAEALAKQIEAQLVALQAQVAAAQAAAEAAGQKYADAQAAVDEQVVVVGQLQAQADAAKAEADKAQQTADGLLSMLGRPGGGSLTSSLLADPGEADALLYRIGAMQKLTEQSNNVYSKAVQLKGVAQSATDQATQAQTELDRRRAIAEQAFQEAQAAADAAAAAYEAEQQHQAELQAQLVVLKERRDVTAADYQKGVAERLAAAAAGVVNPGTGWARPAAGYISSSFGMRVNPFNGAWSLHSGTDIAGGGCGAPIYAASDGVVTYAGPNGDLGNFIQIQHPNGVVTGYGHIIAGGILVARGQQVGAGQNIARVGSTGGSTGCHLHFMVRINGNLTDPVPFMRGKGMPLG